MAVIFYHVAFAVIVRSHIAASDDIYTLYYHIVKLYDWVAVLLYE
jgi:hypothetical protein